MVHIVFQRDEAPPLSLCHSFNSLLPYIEAGSGGSNSTNQGLGKRSVGYGADATLGRPLIHVRRHFALLLSLNLDDDDDDDE